MWHPSSRVLVRAAGLGTLLVVVGGLALVIRSAQDRSRHELQQRFQLRASLSSRFVEAWVRELVASERAQARHRLGGAAPTHAFEDLVRASRFSAAVLLDGRGRLLAVWPRRRDLLGRDLTRRYPHLRRAVRGRVAVSDVVRSAARHVPIVALAVPFATPGGRRVFSGAFSLARTPIAAYLPNASPIHGSTVDLIDSKGIRIASGRARGARPLSQELLRSLPASGQWSSTRIDGRFLVSGPVPGTAWRLVQAAPEASLYEPVRGEAAWVPWLAFSAFAVTLAATVLLLLRLQARQRELTRLNDELAIAARVDSLTGLVNRRGLDERVRAELARTRRTDGTFAVVAGDLDGFKALNDRSGHQQGDAALERVGALLRMTTRTVDTAARAGGDEFTLLLPETDADGAVVAAERVRAAIASAFAEDDVALTISLGVAIAPADGDTPDTLLRAADEALYRAKARGGDQAVAFGEIGVRA